MRALFSFAQIFNFSKFTYATVVNNATIGIAAIVACLIISVIATTNTATTNTTIVSIIVAAGCTATTTRLMIKRANCCYYDLLVVPSIDNKPDAMPKSSSSSPFYACEYQNRACCGTL